MKEHNYGIDLLKLVLMFMVSLLHTLGKGGVLDVSVKGTVYFGLFWLLEIFSFCAVDSFAFISGYIAENKPKQYSKLINMWFQVFFYSFIISCILKLFGYGNDVGIKEFIKYGLPLTFNIYWYITSYFILFIVTPILNKTLFNLNKNESKKTLIVLFLIFTLLNFCKEPLQTIIEYSPIWIIVLYSMGVLAKKSDLFKKKSSINLIVIWLLCIIGTWVLLMFRGDFRLVSYISPTILISGIIMVVLFSRLKIKGKTLNKFSSLALGIYLFQLNPIIWNYIINDRFIYIINYDIFKSTLLVLLISSIIFISGLTVEYIRQKIFKKLKIDILSEKIIKMIENILNKVKISLS